MSDDLISRSALLKEIENIEIPFGDDNNSYVNQPRVLDIIAEQQTAYDVESKCEQICKCMEEAAERALNGSAEDFAGTLAYNNALNILRKGGAE